MNIVGILLAAGESRRMGKANKLLLEYGDHTVFEEVLTNLSKANLDEIVVVTGYEREPIERLVRDSGLADCRAVYNSQYKEGRATSVRCAVSLMKDDTDAALFMVADKPQVTSTLINETIGKFIEVRPKIVHVSTPAGRGHPIIFSKELFPELISYDGEEIGEYLIDKYRGETALVYSDTNQLNLNTPADYRRLHSNHNS